MRAAVTSRSKCSLCFVNEALRVCDHEANATVCVCRLKVELLARRPMRRKTVEEPYPGLFVTPTEFGCHSRASTG